MPQLPPVPPVPPTPPLPPFPPMGAGGPGRIVIQTPGGGTEVISLPGAPRTAADLAALRARRSELSTQLNSASNRRERVARELEDASGPTRAGLEQRLQVLDQRIAQLELDIAENGRLLASAPAGLLSNSQKPTITFPGQTGRSTLDLEPIIVCFILFVLAPIAVSIARAIWRRAGQPPRQPALSHEDSQRLVRLEQAVESIAIEMERVSEGQRFVTNLLADRQGAETMRIGR